MKTSTQRILTTHTGSLPRSADLIELLAAREKGTLRDNTVLEQRVSGAVAEVVRRQIGTGIDIVNDGEQSKMVYATYVKDRLNGFEGESAFVFDIADLREFPEYAQRMFKDIDMSLMKLPSCNGPISWKNRGAVQRDIENLKAAVSGSGAEEVFMSAASPGVIALFLRNEHYPNHEAYVQALAEVMKEEYEAIARAGFLLQLDCPDLAMGRHIRYGDLPTEEFLKIAESNVEAINQATRDIPPDRMRMHVCWGNNEGPHHRDIPLKEIIGIIFKARPAAVSVEACNPRHGYEWEVFREIKLPDGKVLIPGVIDSTTNFIEHPRLVVQRIRQYANLIGKEHVIAGTDCGFATAAYYSPVDPKIAWAKLGAMVEGARQATEELW